MSLRLARLWIVVLFCAPLFAGSLTVTVKDPGQALVGDAVVEVTSADNVQHKQSTDNSGRAAFEQLPAGTYRVAVRNDGFANWEGSIKVGDRPVGLAVALKLAAVSSSVRVTARRSPLANSDPNYQALRLGKLSKVYQVSNFVLTRDAGTLTFRSGSFSFLPAVLGHVTTGVFVGDGNFQLKTADNLAALRLKHMMGSESVSEDFTAMVVFFSDATFDDVNTHSQIVDASPVRHEEELKRVRSVIQVRKSPESLLRPLTQLERMLNFEDIPNYDAEILAELYNGDTGERNGSFRAFVRGRKYGDLRFVVNPRGAMPVLRAPEEVGLIDFDPNSDSDGVWYLGHRSSETKPDSKEEKRLIAPEHYKIEAGIGNPNAIGNQPNLTVTCELKFHALQDGVRMLKLDMIADLQVARVTWNGNEIPFVEESRSHDGSFYLQTPEALMKGRTYDVTFEYAGGEILQSMNGGIPPRRIWYPTPVGGVSRATYDLTFRVPSKSLIVASGKEVRQTREGAWDVSEWTSDVPITQAVFRWLENGTFKTALEQTTGTQMSVYTADNGGRGFLPPSSGDVLIDTGNALRVFSSWFGYSAFENVAVVVANSADSLPGVVYVPPIAAVGYSSVVTQRMVRSGGAAPMLDPKARTGLDEAFASLMALQWWGNTVTPASFHDQWLSAGLASFSASVYDTEVSNGDYKERWDRARDGLLQKNRYGARPNDAGPVWMGILNDAPKTPAASFMLNAQKGAFVVQMLRSLMWDEHSGDGDFQAMMQEFLARFANSRVSTEDFQQVVEKHMKPRMDLDGNHRMDWFFDEWIYGTEVPSYRLEYSLKPGESGGTVIEGKLTQSGVSPSFRMLVPVFGEFAGKKDRLGVMAMRGNSTREFKVPSDRRPKQVLLNINHDILSERDEVVVAKR
jgi:hypothetical protein